MSDSAGSEITAADVETLLVEATRAIHEAECEAYTHEGRNARCERSARAVVAALAPLIARDVEATP